MLYRIFTERKNEELVLSLVQDHFTGFTAYPATGYYYGVKEDALVIEIDTLGMISPKALTAKLKQLVEEIKNLNHQESVMVQEIPAYKWG